MSDEEKILKKIGKENPFKVPDGYFEDFQQQLMSSLPERVPFEKTVIRIPLWRKRPFWASAAAALVGVVVLFASLRTFERQGEDKYASIADGIVFTEEEMDYLVSSVFDDYTLYSYLTNDE